MFFDLNIKRSAAHSSNVLKIIDGVVGDFCDFQTFLFPLYSHTNQGKPPIQRSEELAGYW